MPEEISKILEPVVLSLITALVSIVIVVINSGKEAFIKWIKSRTSASQQVVIDRVAEEAHAYAERWALENGKDKLDMAVEYASRELEERGVSVSQEKIKAAIQSAWQQYNWNKPRSGEIPLDPPS